MIGGIKRASKCTFLKNKDIVTTNSLARNVCPLHRALIGGDLIDDDQNGALNETRRPLSFARWLRGS